MSNDLIRYDLQVQDALRGVVRKVLADAARDGLPGEHHFYITFRTQAAGVRMSNRLREQYPEEMTIILQYQFWDLKVDEAFFEVGLHFKNVPEKLHIPFEAISGFFDPSVQFGLKFEAQGEGDDDFGEEEDETVVGPVANPQPASGRDKAKAEDAARPRGAGSEPQLTPAGPAKTGDKGGTKAAVATAKPETEKPETETKVVSIDAFRKKT